MCVWAVAGFFTSVFRPCFGLLLGFGTINRKYLVVNLWVGAGWGWLLIASTRAAATALSSLDSLDAPRRLSVGYLVYY